MRVYLLIKLAEEAGEVVVAAIKHKLHNTSRTRRELEGEIGDFLAIISIMAGQGIINKDRTETCMRIRKKRELNRCSTKRK